MAVELVQKPDSSWEITRQSPWNHKTLGNVARREQRGWVLPIFSPEGVAFGLPMPCCPCQPHKQHSWPETAISRYLVFQCFTESRDFLGRRRKLTPQIWSCVWLNGCAESAMCKQPQEQARASRLVAWGQMQPRTEEEQHSSTDTAGPWTCAAMVISICTGENLGKKRSLGLCTPLSNNWFRH